MGNCPLVGCPAFTSVEAICRPDESVPSLTSGPSALTNRIAAQPGVVVGATVVHVVPSVEYEMSQPAGARTSDALVKTNSGSSSICTI